MQFLKSADEIKAEAKDHLAALWKKRQKAQAVLDKADAEVNEALYQITSRKIMTFTEAGKVIGFKDSSAYHRAAKAKLKSRPKVKA